MTPPARSKPRCRLGSERAYFALFARRSTSSVSFGRRRVSDRQAVRDGLRRGHPVGAFATSCGGGDIAADQIAACPVRLLIGPGPFGDSSAICASRPILVQTGPDVLRGCSPQAMASHDVRGPIRGTRYVSSGAGGSHLRLHSFQQPSVGIIRTGEAAPNFPNWFCFSRSRCL
jgi:hypothetical protein